MSKFRKKPVVVEAAQFLPGALHANPVPMWLRQHLDCGNITACASEASCVIIRTPEGDHRVAPGDWIIRGVKGELYPCKPDIFSQTYEPVPTEA